MRYESKSLIFLQHLIKDRYAYVAFHSQSNVMLCGCVLRLLCLDMDTMLMTLYEDIY